MGIREILAGCIIIMVIVLTLSAGITFYHIGLTEGLSQQVQITRRVVENAN